MSIDELRDQLGVVAQIAQTRSPAGLHYPCPEALVLDAGRVFCGRRRPAGIDRGPDRECYANALECAVRHELGYAEGYALTPTTGLATAHAWCVSVAGEAIDPTWDDAEQCAYLGVVIPTADALRIVTRTGMYGVLGNWRDKFSFLKAPYAPA